MKLIEDFIIMTIQYHLVIICEIPRKALFNTDYSRFFLNFNDMDNLRINI